jgi:hypothetical protein
MMVKDLIIKDLTLCSLKGAEIRLKLLGIRQFDEAANRLSPENMLKINMRQNRSLTASRMEPRYTAGSTLISR